MKTTLDLPDHLITEVKIRAAKERRKMKDVIAEALEKGLMIFLDTNYLIRGLIKGTEESGHLLRWSETGTELITKSWYH